MTRLHLDIETYSEVDLRAAGVYRYAEHPSTEILCFSYAFDDGPVMDWKPGQPLPVEVVEHVRNKGEFRAHNAQFERIVLNGTAGKKIGFPHIAIRQCVCTAAKMAASGLPRGLDDAAAQLGGIRKDEGGRITMLQLSKPRKGKELRYTPENAPEKFAILYAYCHTDVEAERSIDHLVPDLSKEEQEIYWLDQAINDRGVLVDVDTVTTIRRMVDAYKERLQQEMLSLTGLKPSQREKVADWVRSKGVELLDLQAATVAAAVKEDIPADVRRALILYSTYNAKATAKFDSIADAVCADNRLHGMFTYHGAGTGRWTSTIVQLHNLARPVIEDPEAAIEVIQQGDIDWLRMNYPKIDPLKVIASCVRPVLMAPEGKTLVFPDYAGIEARYCMWLFNEEWKLEVFRKQDAKTGPDSYVSTYAKLFGVEPESVNKFQRQIGKVVDLAMQYEGGVGAFVTMAGTYRLNLNDLKDAAFSRLPEDVRESAEWMWGRYGRSSGLEHDIYVTCDGLKHMWRQAHPNVKQGWKDVREAAELAVQNPGKVYAVADGKIRFKMGEYRGHNWLCLRLPSGRILRYFNPTWIEGKTVHTDTGFEGEFIEEHFPGELRYWGVDTDTRQYCETTSYGGKWVENATQGGCADILRRALFDMNLAGYHPIGHVHDEPIGEVGDGFEDHGRLTELLCRPLDWAPGLPLNIEMNINRRYKK